MQLRLLVSAPLVLTAASAVLAGGPTVEYNNGLGAGQNEVSYAVLQWPPSITVNTGADTGGIYGQVWQGGWTEAPGPNPAIVAQLGYGPIGSDPLLDDSGWTWINATYNVQAGNNDEYVASFTAPAPGNYAYTYRLNLSTFWAGQNLGWTLADLNGAGSNPGLGYDAGQLGVLHVTPTPGAAALMGVAMTAGLRRRRRS
ncbi:MAG: hypothetical protein K2Q09_09760 [Phycisphaerales bacterium]|nr:hypothetical protein [Phycisphaerales bacterium]